MEEVSQETTASEEASSEYYEINAPGFMGFYDQNFGYDSSGEGDWLGTNKDKKLIVECDDERYEFISRFSHDVLNGRSQKEWEDDIARAYCQDLMSEFTGRGYADKHSVTEEDFPPVTKIKFVEVWHPREYNFMNDQVKIELHVTSKEDFAAWALRYTEKYLEDWSKLLRDLFTSRSGFRSWYSNDPLVWANQTKSYTDVDNLGEWAPPKRGTSVCVSTLLKLFLWKESNLMASFSGELKQPDFWESFQGTFELHIFDVVGSATTFAANRRCYDRELNTYRADKEQLELLKKNENTTSWKLLEEEE